MTSEVAVGIAMLLGVIVGFFLARMSQIRERQFLEMLHTELTACAKVHRTTHQILQDIHAWGDHNIPAFTKIMGETERQANDCRGEAKECARLLREVNETIKQWVKK